MSTTNDTDQAIFEIASHIASREARSAYLDQACAGDSEKRKRIVELLKALEGHNSFLESPAIERDLPVTIDQPMSQHPGEQIGPYKLLQQIGEGGMGTVWMADQLEPVRRRVALKLIKPGMDSRQVLARFEAERQALSLMDHPNIAKVLDAGTIGAAKGDRSLLCEAPEGPSRQKGRDRRKGPDLFFSGRPYFVMELVKGQPITDYCDEQHLTPRERLELFLPVCHAIQHAHQKGIIHRDIKPSNVLVAQYDGRPVAKVIDFGIAKAMHQPLTEKTMFTGMGQIVGTLEYMSPEQARVNQLDIDTRSDVYSLGVLLYELLTGSTPFDRKRLREAALDELLRIIREEEPPRPSTKLSSSETLPNIAANRKTEPARLSSIVRGELDWIVMKSLEKDRSRRYETANGFAMDIQRLLNDEAVLACPPSSMYRFRKFARRNKPLIATTSLVAVAIVLGLIGTAWQALRATRAEAVALVALDEKEQARRDALVSARREAEQRQLAEAAAKAEAVQRAAAEASEQKAVEEAAVATAVSEFLQKDLLGLAGAEAQISAGIVPDPDLKLTTLLDRAKIKAEDRFADQPHVLAAVRATLAGALSRIGRYRESAELWEKVQNYRERTFGADHTDTLSSANRWANAYYYNGELSKALPLYEQILELRKAKQGVEHPDTLDCMNNLAAAYLAADERGKSLSLFEQVLELRSATLGPDHRDTLSIMNNLASAYKVTGRIEQAVHLFEKALDMRKSVLGIDHPDTLISMSNLAGAYDSVGKLELSLPLHQHTLESMKSVLGPDHPDTLTAINNLAVAYRAAGETDHALMLFEQVLEKTRAKLGHDHPSTINRMNNLAVVYQSVGMVDESLLLSQEALDLTTVKLGPEHEQTLESMSYLALGYQGKGDLDSAIPLLEKALEIRKSKHGAEHPSTLTSMYSLGLAYFTAGDLERALPLQQQTLELKQDILGPEHPHTLFSMNNLGLTYHATGDLGKALSLFEKTAELRKSKLGFEHPGTLGTFLNVAIILHQLEEYVQALEIVRTVLESNRIRAATQPQDRQLRAKLLQLSVELRIALGQFEEAETDVRQAMEIRQELSPNSWETSVLTSLLGECLLRQQKLAESEPLLLDGFHGLRQHENQLPKIEITRQLKSAAIRLIRLYEALQNPDQLDHWQQILDDINATPVQQVKE